MNKLGRILLAVGGLVLVLLVVVLLGRGQRAAPPSETGAPTEMTITTAAPPEPAPAQPPAPLPAPVHEPAPMPAAIPRLEPDLQVQEDAAAVGMTTLDEPALDELPIDVSQTTPASATADPLAVEAPAFED